VEFPLHCWFLPVVNSFCRLFFTSPVFSAQDFSFPPGFGSSFVSSGQIQFLVSALFKPQPCGRASWLLPPTDVPLRRLRLATRLQGVADSFPGPSFRTDSALHGLVLARDSLPSGWLAAWIFFHRVRIKHTRFPARFSVVGQISLPLPIVHQQDLFCSYS
jgi:hypothetical protein